MNKNFTTAIRVNKKTRTIEITKKFDKAAARFGTEEYSALQQVRKDYPDFNIVVRKTRSKKGQLRGLTYEFMAKYIASHDDEEQTNMKMYDNMRLCTGVISYIEVKAWFIETYPEIKMYLNHSASGLNAA